MALPLSTQDPKLAPLAKEVLNPGLITELCDVGDKLGQGGFAVVRSGKWKETGETVAVKVILPKAYTNFHQRQTALHEVLVLKKVSALKHANVLAFKSAHEDISPTTGIPRLTIVTELCSGGELFDAIVAAGHYSEADAATVTRKLADALASVHSAGVVHRDLKPENILLRSKAPGAEPVLADFGLARCAGEVENLPGVVGTYAYLSPEIITQKLYGEASDVWALGVLVYILVCGYPPFYAEGNDTRPLFMSICRGAYEFHEDAWGDVSKEGKHLIARMLTVDPKKRATMKEVLSHPWIQKNAALPTAHRAKTLTNLKAFNARRRLRAAAKAVMWGAGHLQAVRYLEQMLGGKDLAPQELANLSAAFHKIAHMRNTVTLKEFTDVLASVGLGDIPAPRLFAVFDIDGSGDVDYREFIAGLAAIRRGDEGALKMCFRMFDKDGDGAISREELIQMLAATGFDAAADASAPARDGAVSPVRGGGGGASAPAAAAAAAGAGSSSSSSPGGAAAIPPRMGSDSTAVDESAVLAAADEANAATAADLGVGMRLLEPAYVARLEKIFTTIDTNKDGKLTFEEFIAAVKADKALADAIWHPVRTLLK